jgi:arylsulfatase A-like enzyme
MNPKTTRRGLLAGTAASLIAGTFASRSVAKAIRRRKPNILFIYADDLGYRDLSCYGATAVSTPNVDRLASNGVRFTNGHAPSATCTPSRYAFLTGEYAWRNPSAHILPGDAPALIKPGKPTVASMLKQAGYKTAAIGKWHMGLGNGNLDWNGVIAPGPLEIGFDYAFYFPATLDRVPCIFIENHHVVNLDPKDPIKVNYREKVGNDPTGLENPQQLKMMWNDGHNGTIVDGVSRIGWMEGGHSARWVDEDMADTLVGKASAFFEENRSEPFFMYFAASEIHVPRMPARRFQGATKMGPRGDSIVEFDWVVGALVQKLEQLGILDNTLIVLSSDNGPVLNDGYDDGAVKDIGDHRPSGPFRSGKYSIYDGGLRVPLISHWPDAIPAGMTSPALVDCVDMFATFADLVQEPLTKKEAVDSFDLLPALTGSSLSGRSFVVEDTSTINSEQSSLTAHGDSILALVEGDWKIIKPQGASSSYFHGNAIGDGPQPQLFNIAEDPGETVNLATRYPERAGRMLARLEAILASARTRPS